MFDARGTHMPLMRRLQKGRLALGELPSEVTQKWPEHIFTRADRKKWFHTLIFENGLNFHPDDSAEVYVKVASGERIFNEDEAARFDALMAEAFDAPGDVYVDAMAELNKHLGLRKLRQKAR